MTTFPKITSDYVPESTDRAPADEPGFYAHYYEDGQLREFGYRWPGEDTTEGFVLHLGHNDGTAYVERRRKESLDPEFEGLDENEWKESYEKFVKDTAEYIIQKSYAFDDCGFCFRSQGEAGMMVRAPGIFVCFDCVRKLVDIVAAAEQQ